MRRETRHGGRSRLLTAALAAGVALAGCSDQGPTGDPAPAQTPSGATATTTTSPAPGDVDCARLEQARADLSNALGAELTRLGVDRTAPEAFGITYVATSQHAADYWQVVAETAPQNLRDEAQRIAGYWAEVDARTADVTIPDGSPEAVAAAVRQVDERTSDVLDPQVVPLQQAAEEALSVLCR
jgi:hypothetical protein